MHLRCFPAPRKEESELMPSGSDSYPIIAQSCRPQRWCLGPKWGLLCVQSCGGVTQFQWNPSLEWQWEGYSLWPVFIETGRAFWGMWLVFQTCVPAVLQAALAEKLQERCKLSWLLTQWSAHLAWSRWRPAFFMPVCWVSPWRGGPERNGRGAVPLSYFPESSRQFVIWVGLLGLSPPLVTAPTLFPSYWLIKICLILAGFLGGPCWSHRPLRLVESLGKIECIGLCGRAFSSWTWGPGFNQCTTYKQTNECP